MASHTVSFFCPNFHLSESLNTQKCLQIRYRMFTQTLKPNDNGQVYNSMSQALPRSGQCPSSLAPTWMRLGVQVAVDMRKVFNILEREKVIITPVGGWGGGESPHLLLPLYSPWGLVVSVPERKVLRAGYLGSYSGFQAQGK